MSLGSEKLVTIKEFPVCFWYVVMTVLQVLPTVDIDSFSDSASSSPSLPHISVS